MVRGTVIDNNDPYGGSRIKVKLGNVHDGSKSDKEIMWCSPLLPKLLHVIPKIGEMVIVFFEKGDAGESNRFYIGPVLSQPQRFTFETKPTAETFLDNPNGHQNTTLPHPDRNMEINQGSLPKTEDVAILGRDNSEIRFSDNSLYILCGLKKNGCVANYDNIMEFNKKDPAFIQMQWNEREDEGTDMVDNKYKSSVNIYADRINLLSRFSNKNIGELDSDELLSPEQMSYVLCEAHPLVFGDYLIDYLQKLQAAFLAHTHAYSMLPPVSSAQNVELSQTKFDNMLSKAVKTC